MIVLIILIIGRTRELLNRLGDRPWAGALTVHFNAATADDCNAIEVEQPDQVCVCVVPRGGETKRAIVDHKEVGGQRRAQLNPNVLISRNEPLDRR